MNIGILYCGYNQIENIKNTLSFWNQLSLPDINISVVVVSVPFLEYKDMRVPIDESTLFIEEMSKQNIKEVVFEPTYVRERVARSICLDKLRKYRPDFLWQVDSDEYYTEENVINILNYLKNTEHLTYSINFKNYIFDGLHYLDDFCVPKINRMMGHNILYFADDNQVVYDKDGVVNPQKIDKNIAYVKHLSWLHKNGKYKVEYQKRHFGDCSYKWNENTQQLEIDFDYYRRYGYVVPNIIKEFS